MSEKKHLITVTKNQGTENQEVHDVMTDGYLLLHLEDEKIKMEGNLELKALAPMIMKAAMDKFTRND